MSCIYYASKKIRINREEILFVCKVVSILWSLMLRITYQRSKEEDMFSFINFDEINREGRKKRIFLKNILWMENIIYKLVVINKLKLIIKRIEEWLKRWDRKCYFFSNIIGDRYYFISKYTRLFHYRNIHLYCDVHIDRNINSQNSSCVRVEILIIRDIPVVIEYLLFVLIIGKR